MLSIFLKILTAVIIAMIAAFLIYAAGVAMPYFLPVDPGFIFSYYDVWVAMKVAFQGISAFLLALIYFFTKSGILKGILLIAAAIPFFYLDLGSLFEKLKNPAYFRDDIFRTAIDLIISAIIFAGLITAANFIHSKFFEKKFNDRII